jgi:hypothetical protein
MGSSSSKKNVDRENSQRINRTRIRYNNNRNVPLHSNQVAHKPINGVTTGMSFIELWEEGVLLTGDKGPYTQTGTYGTCEYAREPEGFKRICY